MITTSAANKSKMQKERSEERKETCVISSSLPIRIADSPLEGSCNAALKRKDSTRLSYKAFRAFAWLQMY